MIHHEYAGLAGLENPNGGQSTYFISNQLTSFLQVQIVRKLENSKHETTKIQLDLFELRDQNYDYKVIVTNNQGSAKLVLLFHNGRGSQEGVFAVAKTETQLDYTPTNSLNGNRIFTAAVVLTKCIQLYLCNARFYTGGRF